jgi:hypothetical protein
MSNEPQIFTIELNLINAHQLDLIALDLIKKGYKWAVSKWEISSINFGYKYLNINLYNDNGISLSNGKIHENAKLINIENIPILTHN